MAKVFISYSRKDIEFARRLTAELKKSTLDFRIDWEGIPPTVDWWREIEKGIEETDIFFILISPDSVHAQTCRREIDHAIKNGKRLIPLIVRASRQQFIGIPTMKTGDPHSVGYNEDGNLMTINPASGEVTLWNLQKDFRIQRASSLVAGKKFSSTDWNKYFPGEFYRETCNFSS